MSKEMNMNNVLELSLKAHERAEDLHRTGLIFSKEGQIETVNTLRVEAIAALKEAIKQQETCDTCVNWKHFKAKCGNATCSYEAIKQQGEPFAWYDDDALETMDSVDIVWNSQKPTSPGDWLPLFTSAPTIPEGWPLVPKILDEAMLDALKLSGAEGSDENLQKDHAAMLSAAPKGETA